MGDDNDDVVKPTKERFDRVLRGSYALWSSYVDLEGPTTLPIECIDLKRIFGRTPSFLGHGLIPENESVPLKCSESSGTLYVNGHSTWKTSHGTCRLGPKEIHRTVLLATQAAMNVELSDSVPFAEWPGVQGLEGYDEGNYIAVLFLAWAYIRSARWSALLNRSPEHWCMVTFKKESLRCEAPMPQSSIEVDTGDDATDDEGCGVYGQCSAALSTALCIPFVWTKSTSLPAPKMSATSKYSLDLPYSPSIHTYEHYGLLPRYMMLSCDVWGIRSLLHIVFFNPDIECNSVAAWMSAAFAVLDPVTQAGNIVKLLKILATRLPKLAPLWLGAMLVDNLHTAAWTGTVGPFITLRPGVSDDKVIRREDECRLLHIIGCGSYARPPVWPWRPIGETLLNDSELEAHKHAQYNCHCLEYQAWDWELADGKGLEARGADAHQPDDNVTQIDSVLKSTPSQCSIDCLSDDLSANPTRGIFGWLRSTGYLANERHVYKHPWFDVGDSDEDEILDNQGILVELMRQTDKSMEKGLEKCNSRCSEIADITYFFCKDAGELDRPIEIGRRFDETAIVKPQNLRPRKRGLTVYFGAMNSSKKLL
ncbi:hypothetical protein BDV38DRAFT_267840 [Aspergillus pseudotamarii]|uniref:Uncharacterized protein n=1 Tax=Aspergillus pseudotamarii TaxID=132259 RepID=A0A5N6T8G8_ASPPS|nr:uncharacterized protein BDV38DRAFT_267840 [Aspergillus pseudotamarii]KAE8142645.1 hypothetical protein BDV38DRAFT_267840 [Aspergillus pseudotamarii]